MALFALKVKISLNVFPAHLRTENSGAGWALPLDLAVVPLLRAQYQDRNKGGLLLPVRGGGADPGRGGDPHLLPSLLLPPLCLSQQEETYQEELEV